MLRLDLIENNPFTSILTLSSTCQMNVYADPPQKGKWDSILELTDEFEADALNPRKWHDHNPQWKHGNA